MSIEGRGGFAGANLVRRFRRQPDSKNATIFCVSLFDNIKNQAVKTLMNSGLAQQVVPLITEALQKAEGASVETLSNESQFRLRVSEPSYGRLPGAVRALLTMEQWHDVMFSLKDQWFLVKDGRLRLQPELHAALQAFVQQLIYGKRSPAGQKGSRRPVDTEMIELQAGVSTNPVRKKADDGL